LAAEIMTCGPEAVKACLTTLRGRQENCNDGLQVENIDLSVAAEFKSIWTYRPFPILVIYE